MQHDSSRLDYYCIVGHQSRENSKVLISFPLFSRGGEEGSFDAQKSFSTPRHTTKKAFYSNKKSKGSWDAL